MLFIMIKLANKIEDKNNTLFICNRLFYKLGRFNCLLYNVKKGAKVVKNTLNENIKKIRLEKKITQEELGNFIGVNKATIQRYESGIISNIPSDKIENIARYFKVTPAYLMGWAEEQEEPKLKVLAKNFEKLSEKDQEKIISIIEIMINEEDDNEYQEDEE